MAPPPNSVLVIGAGELGLAMVSALHAHPLLIWISVLLRPSTLESTSPSKKALRDTLTSKYHAKLIAGDYATDTIASLSATFSQFDTVIVCSGFTHGAACLQTKITRAVLDAKVRRYIPWQFGVDYDILGAGSSQDSFDEQLEVRGLLRAQNEVGWCIVSVGVFMSFLFEPWWGVVDLEAGDNEGGKVRALGSWETKITTTAPEDIGTCTVDVLAVWDEDQHEHQVRDSVVFVAGETLSYGELADSVEKGLGRKLKRETWDMGFLMNELSKDPENGLKKYRPIFAGDKGIAWDYQSSWNAKRDIKTVSTEEWASRLR